MKRRILSLLLSIVILTGLLPTTAMAAGETSGTCGDSATWEFKEDTDTLLITGTGAMNDYAYSWESTAPWKAFQSEIQHVQVTGGITHIGSGAFGGDMVSVQYPNLKTVAFNDSLQSIGKYAFGGAPLESITLPDSLISIGDAAFSDTLLTSINIPASVSSVGGDGWFAFDCDTLTTITVDGGNQNFEVVNRVLYNKGKTKLIYYPQTNPAADYTIPSTITQTLYISDFSGIDALRSITIPAGVTLTAREGYGPPGGLEYDDSQSIILYFEGEVPEITEDWCFIRGGAIIKIDARKATGEPVNPDDKLDYVKWLTHNSLNYADAETKQTIENAIYNLLFKAQYRPTESKIPGDIIQFTGSLDVNKTWPYPNYQGVGYSITDNVLGKVKIEGSAGCMSYASFAAAYTYGTPGVGIACTDRSANGIKNFIHRYVDPGEHIRYKHSSNRHSIVFLGESEDEKGFYYISFNGGPDFSLFVGYRTYEQFAKIITTNLNVRDTNGGSYSAGTAQNISEVRKKNVVNKIVEIHECPVEVRIYLGEEVLDSRNPGSASFGSVERTDDKIVFTLDYHEDYRTEIVGTGVGVMKKTVEYYADETLLDKRVFVNVPIREDTLIFSSGYDALGAYVLHCSTSDGNNETWGAGINETVYGPDADYSSEENGPDYDTVIPESPSGSSSNGTQPTYKIAVGLSDHGSITVSPQNAKLGDTVTISVKPDNGYELDNLTVTDKNGIAVKLTSKGDGKYIFTMPAGKVDVKVSFVKATLSLANPFYDVSEDTYYYDAVLWAVENEITGGTSATTFSPNAPCTRAQIVTFLWRAAGTPRVDSVTPFTDVTPDSYYAQAVAWAVQNTITSGTTATTFDPNATVTRGQTVTFLYRAAGSPATSGTPFGDVAADAYYADAVTWAVENAITNGTTATTFAPANPCTRAQIVTFLYRDRA